MQSFNTKYAAQILNTHQPNQRAYLCSEIGLEPNTQNAADIDAAYAELAELGLVKETNEQTVMMHFGGRPRHPFRLTDKGVDAQEPKK